jgi:4-hydroxybenzoate polyprenyltransferase
MKISGFSKYLSLIKFNHTVFAMPFAVVGYITALHLTEAAFDLWLFLLVLLCMIFARSAAMAFNRYADRKIDFQNPRTSQREIPAGVISPASALTFTIINSLLFITATWFINPLCFALSPLALLIILGYSYTKRFTSLCHLILGLGLSLAPVGAYIAVTGAFHATPVFFSLAVLFWVSGFDILYALQDITFDREMSLKSIPAKVGTRDAMFVSALLHFLSAVCIIAAGVSGNFSSLYWIGASLFLLMLFYQHRVISHQNLSGINMVFFTTNGVASIAFAVFVVADVIFSA